ncbi:MAG: glycosyltransferase family 1 protein [Chloroflexota bacterium]
MSAEPSNEHHRVVVDARPLQDASSRRGIGTYARGLIGGLLRAGWGPRLGLLLDGGLPLPDLPEGTGLVVYSVRRRYRGRLAPWEDAVALGRDLARIRPALFHALTLSQPATAPCPVAVTVHDLIPWAWSGPGLAGDRLRHALGKRRLRGADAVIAVSESTASDTARLAGVRRERIEVIPEGVDRDFRPVPGAGGARWDIRKPFLVFVGALDRRKNPRALLRAWAVAREMGADCELVLAGEPGRQAPDMAGARSLGYLPAADLAELLSAAGCLVFPSRYEGFGLPVLEAMACGCPVVAYRNSSLPEVVDRAGVLVDDGDPVALAAAAAAFLLDARLRGMARKAGMRWAARFTWDATARRTAAVYDRLLEGRL